MFIFNSEVYKPNSMFNTQIWDLKIVITCIVHENNSLYDWIQQELSLQRINNTSKNIYSDYPLETGTNHYFLSSVEFSSVYIQ